MSGFWAERSQQLERMDVESLDLPTLSAIFKNLETINARIGGVSATLHHIARFSQAWRPGEKVRFIDWGTGGADMPRALVRWGRARGFQFEVTGLDNNPLTVEYARQACRDYPEISILEGDFFEAAAALDDITNLRKFDYALSSLCLHHLKDDAVVALLKLSDRVTSRGMIMNDLRRSVRAWLWIWTLSRAAGAHPIVQDDGPLSVRRAFRAEELEALAARAGLTYLKVKTHFGYRLTLAGEKSEAPASPLPQWERGGLN